MEIDPGQPIDLDVEAHEACAQWEFKDSGPLDGHVHIQVGTLAGGGWYVNHMRFGARRFTDRQAAWDATRGLMARHEGRWDTVDPDSKPFAAVRRPDGSRALYDTLEDECLYACWGDQKDQLWARYTAAIDAGETLRKSETHELLDGGITMVSYRDPLDGTDRYAVTTDWDSEYCVVDYPDRDQAEAAYEHEVLDHADDELPYKSSDIAELTVDRRSRAPDGLTVLPDGSVIATDDVDEYNYMYGQTPRGQWPVTPDQDEPPGPVTEMTAEPRDWGPTDVNVKDVTSAAWADQDEELEPNDLALLALPDGRQLLASAHDGAAHVWSLRDGTKLKTFSGHSEWVLAVALTVVADGAVVLATGGRDGLARAWSVRDGVALQEIEAHKGPVNAVAWACPPRDIPWLVTGGDDAHVRVWDIEFKRPRAEFRVGKPSVDLVWSVAATVLSTGEVCVVAGSQGIEAAAVHVWNASTRTLLHTFVVESDVEMPYPKVAVATLADRSFRVAAIAGPVLRIWDGLSGREVRTLPVPGSRGGDVALVVLPDLRVIVAAASGPETLVWELESGMQLARLTHRSDFHETVDLVVYPDDTLLLVSGRRDESLARVVRLDLHW